MVLTTVGRVWFYDHPIDCRKSIDGLALLVASALGLAPQSGDVFVFGNRKADKVKVLTWDCNGFCLLYKRLEKERFHLPFGKGQRLQLTVRQLRWLLEGLDIHQIQGHQPLSFDTYY